MTENDLMIKDEVMTRDEFMIMDESMNGDFPMFMDELRIRDGLIMDESKIMYGWYGINQDYDEDDLLMMDDSKTMDD